MAIESFLNHKNNFSLLWMNLVSQWGKKGILFSDILEGWYRLGEFMEGRDDSQLCHLSTRSWRVWSVFMSCLISSTQEAWTFLYTWQCTQPSTPPTLTFHLRKLFLHSNGFACPVFLLFRSSMCATDIFCVGLVFSVGRHCTDFTLLSFFWLSSDAVHLVTYYCLPYLSSVEISKWPKIMSLSMKMYSLVSGKKSCYFAELFKLPCAWPMRSLDTRLITYSFGHLAPQKPVCPVKLDSCIRQRHCWIQVHWIIVLSQRGLIIVLSQSALNQCTESKFTESSERYITSLGSIKEQQHHI